MRPLQDLPGKFQPCVLIFDIKQHSVLSFGHLTFFFCSETKNISAILLKDWKWAKNPENLQCALLHPVDSTNVTKSRKFIFSLHSHNNMLLFFLKHCTFILVLFVLFIKRSSTNKILDVTKLHFYTISQELFDSARKLIIITLGIRINKT